jgi:aspartyl-tRNA(Asn)/glutamyl-tRNA(Gln) amidotransferase subunit C
MSRDNNQVMALNEHDLKKIASLAKLKLQGEDENRLLSDLNKILDYMEIINKLDTEDISVMSHPSGGETPLRSDQAKPGLNRDEVMKNVPVEKDGLIGVPKVFKSSK